jgi:hypothetical protein
VEQRECKGILPSTIILVNDDTEANVWTNDIYVYMHALVHKCGRKVVTDGIFAIFSIVLSLSR